MPALAVDKEQSLVRRQAAQAERPHESRPVLRNEFLHVEGHYGVAQNVIEVGRALGEQRFPRNNIDWARRFHQRHASAARSGNDDRVGNGISVRTNGPGGLRSDFEGSCQHSEHRRC